MPTPNIIIPKTIIKETGVITRELDFITGEERSGIDGGTVVIEGFGDI